MTVGTVDTSASNGITGIVTLIANRNGSTVTFNDGDSTFYAVEVQADKGVLVNQHLSTTAGALYLDADADDADDTGNLIEVAASKEVIAATVLTLESTTGKVHSTLSPREC